MTSRDRDPRYDEVRFCLAEADRAFAGAGATDDERERLRLIEVAETWLVRAERRLARLTDRPATVAGPAALSAEQRSFGDARPAHRSLVWRRQPKA